MWLNSMNSKRALEKINLKESLNSILTVTILLEFVNTYVGIALEINNNA